MSKNVWLPIVSASGLAVGILPSLILSGNIWLDTPVFLAASTYQAFILLVLWRHRPWRKST
ncbi:hypothetical protein BK660_21655 [Pseudomonas brassicacearum]|uniref:Uncharacterized protein n=1 Tax=Pseudomonas brassicacearum TaxID=930166 RepID=A0A423HXF9_9PSED|nr:hypothetical protein BK660_21655 [Pseudomonas brassicacearum]